MPKMGSLPHSPIVRPPPSVGSRRRPLRRCLPSSPHSSAGHRRPWRGSASGLPHPSSQRRPPGGSRSKALFLFGPLPSSVRNCSHEDSFPSYCPPRETPFRANLPSLRGRPRSAGTPPGMAFHLPLVPKLHLGTPTSPQLRCLRLQPCPGGRGACRAARAQRAIKLPKKRTVISSLSRD